jgi:hypothetical protein
VNRIQSGKIIDPDNSWRLTIHYTRFADIIRVKPRLLNPRHNLASLNSIARPHARNHCNCV